MYKSTSRSVIFIPREHGGLGIKKPSDTYRTTRIAFLIKMLNHVQHIRYVARKIVTLGHEPTSS